MIYRYFFVLTASILLGLTTNAHAQTNFRAAMELADPLDRQKVTNIDDQIKVHAEFLVEAVADRNTSNQLYANLFLGYDHIKKGSYPEANAYFLDAQGIAEAADKPGWIGWVFYRRGNLSVRLKKHQEALDHYLNASERCAEVNDSLCMAESLEQASIMSAMLDDYEQAEYYHRISLPLLRKFGETKHLATALNNYGNIRAMQEDHAEAASYLKEAISLYRQENNDRSEAKALNNLANCYRGFKQWDLAIETYQQCLEINRNSLFRDNLLANYKGLYRTMQAKGEHQEANIWLERFHELRDSLMGAEQNAKIADLEIKYQTKQTELELEKSNAELLQTSRSLERMTFFLTLLVVLLIVGFWIWKVQLRSRNRELAQNQQSLSELTSMLLQKNEQLAVTNRKMERDSRSSIHEPSIPFLENVYEMRILTDRDWESFKAVFTKAYPNYIQMLRYSYPDMTVGEERLFLFIKLGLNRSEVATILGISSESVKKSRSRLRKRLQLSEDVNLEQFVASFAGTK